MDLHKLASLMVRDSFIIAKRHSELARDYRAIADTWRQVLDAAVPDVLKELSTQEDGKVGAPASTPPQGSFLFVDPRGVSVE